MPSYTHLAGVSSFADSNLDDILETNLVEFLRWGLMETGAYSEVPVLTPGTPDPYGEETLSPSHLDAIPDGTIWQANHPDWCYETGLETGGTPTVASGVYVNGTFYPASTTTGTYQHYLNFPKGRVVFAAAIPTTSVVQVAYSYRIVGVFNHDQPWFQQVVLGDFGDEQATQTAVVQLLSDHRVQTPFIAVESSMRCRMRGYELGSSAKWISQDLLLHIVSDDRRDVKNLASLLKLQKDTTTFLFDVNARRTGNLFALDWRGMPVAGAPLYPDLVSPAPPGYRLCEAIWENVQGSDVADVLPLYRGIVRVTLSAIWATN